MSVVRIAPLVEGHGEVLSVPVLLRRIAACIDPSVRLEVPRPFRHPSGSLLRAGGLERAITAVALLHPGHAVLVLMDSDDNCPGQLAPQLVQRAARADVTVSIVLPNREYEAWFLAAAESLGGQRGLAKDIRAPECPEEVRDAKGWLSSRMPRASRYSPTQDQPALSALFDLELARRRSRSFRKLWIEVERLLVAEHHQIDATRSATE